MGKVYSIPARPNIDSNLHAVGYLPPSKQECHEPLQSSLRTAKYNNIQRLAIEVVLSSTSPIAYRIYGRTIPKVKWNEALVSYLTTSLEITFTEQ